MRINKTAVLLSFLLAAILGAQTDPKTAAIQGTVVDSVSGLPIPRANVSLRGIKQMRFGATSGADGTFSFTGLPAGTYSVRANKIAYVANNSPGEGIVTLKAGDVKPGVEVRLIPTGSITGRVLDSDGEPIEGAHVQTEGTQGEAEETTDENGRFRVGGLAPGPYRVHVQQDYFMGGRPEIRSDGTAEVHNASTYYPGVLTAKEAGRVNVRPAAETSGIEIRLVKVPFLRVSGRVIDLPHGVHPSLMVERGSNATDAPMKQGWNVRTLAARSRQVYPFRPVVGAERRTGSNGGGTDRSGWREYR